LFSSQVFFEESIINLGNRFDELFAVGFRLGFNGSRYFRLFSLRAGAGIGFSVLGG